MEKGKRTVASKDTKCRISAIKIKDLCLGTNRDRINSDQLKLWLI